MRRLFYLVMACAAVFSCNSGSDDLSTEAEAPYTLSVDKQEIESDGTDAVTFSITDANGKELTVMDNMSQIFFRNETTGKMLPRRSRTYATIEDGEYVFSATFQGVPCENKAKVTSRNRRSYEVFRRNVAVYKLTATWCQYCPTMTEALSRLDEWTKGRIVEIALHGEGSEYAMSVNRVNPAEELKTRFRTGYPSCIYDLEEMNSTRSYLEIESIVFDRLVSAPSTCGIKASSSCQGTELVIKASVASSTGGTYDIGYAVLRDGCVPANPLGAHESVYDAVPQVLSGNYSRMSDEKFSLQPDGESTEKSFVLQLDRIGITEDNADEFSVVVFALAQRGDDVVTDNIVKFPVDGAVDYVRN